MATNPIYSVSIPADWTPTDEAIAELPAPLRGPLERWKRDSAETEQLRLQLAGVSVAALGATSEPVRARRGMYGWSPAYDDTLVLRLRFDAQQEHLQAAIHCLNVERKLLELVEHVQEMLEIGCPEELVDEGITLVESVRAYAREAESERLEAAVLAEQRVRTRDDPPPAPPPNIAVEVRPTVPPPADLPNG